MWDTALSSTDTVDANEWSCVILPLFCDALDVSLAAYCVYEVYSWDVMEPATYFLMVRTVLGSLAAVSA